MSHIRTRTLLLILALLCIVFSACSSSPNYTGAVATTSAPSAAQANMMPASGGMRDDSGFNTSKEMVMEEADFAESESNAQMQPGENAVTTAGNAKRMIITTVTLNLETKEFDAGVIEVEKIVADMGGFVQDSYVEGESLYGRHGGRSASFTVRIPSPRLNEFFNGVSNGFNVTSKSQSSQDITDSYYDTEARLNSLKIQEKRLLEMLASSTELQYLIEVQRELANVQYQIDNFTSTKIRMQNQVDMSTVHISLGEVVEYTPVVPDPVTFGERLLDTITSSLTSFVDVSQGLILVLVWMAPFLIIVGILLFVIIFFARKRKANRKALAAQVTPTEESNGTEE